MNVFEDLVEELKEENLLEETVTEKISAETRAEFAVSEENDEGDVKEASRFQSSSVADETLGEFASTPDFSADFDSAAADELNSEEVSSEAEIGNFSFSMSQPESESQTGETNFE
ncbi:MAG TPA: hypothetical protein VK400_00160, partial [Pyrinomonadaceae bacterium]|nr:hypothetical protein [Pyrinomonadaceae bacterium]